MIQILPNRIAIYLTTGAALAAALAPVVANLDWTSTAGVIAGISAITAVVYKWLGGWQAHEEREAFADREPHAAVAGKGGEK